MAIYSLHILHFLSRLHSLHVERINDHLLGSHGESVVWTENEWRVKDEDEDEDKNEWRVKDEDDDEDEGGESK